MDITLCPFSWGGFFQGWNAHRAEGGWQQSQRRKPNMLSLRKVHIQVRFPHLAETCCKCSISRRMIGNEGRRFRASIVLGSFWVNSIITLLWKARKHEIVIRVLVSLRKIWKCMHDVIKFRHGFLPTCSGFPKNAETAALGSCQLY